MVWQTTAEAFNNIDGKESYTLYVLICDKLVHITDNPTKETLYKIKNS